MQSMISAGAHRQAPELLLECVLPIVTKCIAHLVAKSLHIDLSQLLATHEALDPPVECGDGSGLCLNGRDVGGGPPDILHVGIHYAKRGLVL